jgi:hypothetical protein
MPMDVFLEKHSGELMTLILSALVLLTLLILVPQLLRHHQRGMQLQHEENLRALEKGLPLPPIDERSRHAGRTAALVPMVVICAASTVTCFLAGYKSDNLFAVSLALWSVAGVVSLAAITGGVSLMARLAHLQAGFSEEDSREDPLEERSAP